MAATIGIGIGLIGGGVSAQGSAKAGKAAKRIGNFNAGVADQQADDALARGREAEDQLKSGVRKLIGSQRAGFAAQGVSLADEEGSAVQVEEDTFTSQNADLERIRVNAGREAWGFRMQAQNYRMGGKAALEQRNAEATGTILTSLGNAFTSYSQSEAYKTKKPTK